MKSDLALWRRLESLEFDALDAALPFSRRLARDNRWTEDFARRVVEEYRRFAYLARVSAHEVTPSDEVDQAWHLHLVYTRHYWGPFAEALGAPLHHGPTAGGAAERRRFEENYAATRAAYTREFGAPPPADIWPPAAIRFGEAPFMQRVNMRRVVLLPRRAVRTVAAGAAAFAATTALIGAVAAAETGDVTFDEVLAWAIDHSTLSLAIVFCVVFFVILIVRQLFGRPGGRNGSGCGSSCGGGGDSDSGCGGGD